MNDVSKLSLRAAGVQLHQQVAVMLRDAIASGRFESGSRIPSEKDLGTHFSVSRITIRRALLALQEEGFLEARQGKGTFVTLDPPIRSVAIALSDLEANLKTTSEATRPVVKAYGLAPAPMEVRQLFGSHGSDSVLRVERLHVRGVKVLMRSILYYPDAVAGKLKRQQFSRHSATEVLASAGLARHSVRITIGASLADAVISQRLKVPAGCAIVEAHRFATDSKGNPVEYMLWQADPMVAPYRIAIEGGTTRRMSSLPEI